MAVETLIARYGLWAVFFGAGVEGEAVVLTAGLLAHAGLLPIWGVAAAASAGSCLIDQIWFWTARHFNRAQWVRRAKERPAFKRAIRLLERHLILFTLGFRFVYGMRTVTPVAISASKIRSSTFVLLNIASAIVWGPMLAWIGYWFGGALEPWLHRSKTPLLMAAGLIAAGIVVMITVKVLLRRRTARAADATS